MSYCVKDGDKFYWMNPKDARKGDECIKESLPGDKWAPCKAFLGEGYCTGSQRRRLIDPGVGWRILGVEEQLPRRFEFTKNTITWEYDAFVSDGASKSYGWTVKSYIQSQASQDIIAIRQHIPVEVGKNLIRADMEHGLRLETTAAQARMEGKQEPNYPPTLCCHYQSIVRKDYPIFWNPGNGVVQCHNCGAIYSPAQDELKVLLERVKKREESWRTSQASYNKGARNQCLEFQRWIEEAMQKRNEVPQKVEGDEWYLAWVRDNGGEELSDQQRKVIQHYIKWHAAKVNGGGE